MLAQLSPERAFDFWIGDWDIRHRVLQSDGTWRDFDAGTRVAPILDGHALMENWQGEVLLPWEGMSEPEFRKAISIRAYDPKAQHWNIHWIDTRNRRFIPPSSGNFENGRGEFFSTPDPASPSARGRISFDNITGRSVDWAFAVTDGDGWKTLWEMKMQRRS